VSTIEKALDKLDDGLSPPPSDAPRTAPASAGADAAQWVREAKPDPALGAIDELVAQVSPEPTPELGGQVTAVAGAAPASVTHRRFDMDLSRLARAGLITPDGDNLRTIEEYRVLKRPLLRNLSAATERGVENANVVVITSAIPGEGKTFTAVNLAMSIATELDRTVLLVDGDVQRGDVSRTLGLEMGEGLVEYLEDPSIPLSDFLVRTNVAKLNLLPAGKFHAHVTELIASNQMRRLAGELAARYADRVIIFDGPPLLASSVAGVLAGLAGQILLVVEAIRTPEQMVGEALKLLGRTDNVGLVLNKSRHGHRRGYGGYGYGYGYGYGKTPETAQSEGG